MLGKTEVTADRDKIQFRLFNSSSIFNITLLKELFSLPKKTQTMHFYPGFMALVTWVKFLGEKLGLKIELELNNLNSTLSRSAVTPVFPMLLIFQNFL